MSRQLRFGDYLILRRSVSDKPIPVELQRFKWHVYRFTGQSVKGSHWEAVYGAQTYEECFSYVGEQPISTHADGR